MRFVRGLVLLAALAAVPLEATSLRRLGLEQLTRDHDRAVVAEVVSALSYWNAERTMILTDYEIRPRETAKGEAAESLVVTLLGGTVGSTTTLIVAGAELVPGKSYLLFLNEEGLTPEITALTVREHCQGVFEIVAGKNGEPRAVSQATRHPLVADQAGVRQPPGGNEGVLLSDLLRLVRTESGKEMK